MSASRLVARVIASVTCVAFFGDAQAHVMNSGQVTLNVVGPRVYVAATLPLDAFSTATSEAITAQVTRSLQVSAGRRAQPLQGVIATVDDAGHSAREVHAVLVLGVAIFDTEPIPLKLIIEPEFLARTGKLIVIASRNVDGHPREFGRRTLTTTRNEASFALRASDSDFLPNRRTR